MSRIPSIIERDAAMIPERLRLGNLGERLAAEHLSQNGYRLVLANFKVPVGRNRRGALVTGEIDIIALEGDILCFVEVKTRRSSDFASPLANVDLRKQRQIIRTARVYQRIFGVGHLKRRFDAVSVVLSKRGLPEIELARSFWNEEKFRKRRWNENFSY